MVEDIGAPVAVAEEAAIGLEGDAGTSSKDRAARIDDVTVGDTAESKVPTVSGRRVSYTAHLLCPVSHKSHAHLRGFNMKTCPACGEPVTFNQRAGSSTPPESRFMPRSETSCDYSDSSSVDDDCDYGDVTAGPEKAFLKNTVTIHNTLGHVVTIIPWPGTFDLDEARANTRSSDLAFEIVTTLQTSIPGGRLPPRLSKYRSRGSPMTSDYSSSMELGRAILNDPLMDVAVSRTSIMIHSKALTEIIKSVVSYYPGVNLDCKPVVLEEPFAVIMHHRSQLESFLQPTSTLDMTQKPSSWAARLPNELAKEQLEVFLRFFKQPKYTSPIEEEIERNAEGLCTFRMLWHLLRPGSTVYLSRDGRLSAHVIAEVIIDGKALRPEEKPTEAYEITLWHLDFDGRLVGRCEDYVSIPAFEGERSITSLNIFPVEYRDNVHYKGEFTGPIGRQFDGRVFVDNVAYIEEHSTEEALPSKPQPQRPAGSERVSSGLPNAQTNRHPQALASYKDIPVVGKVFDLGNGLSVCSCDDCRGKRAHPPPGFQWKDYDLIDPLTTQNLELPGGLHGINHRYLLCSRRLFGFVFKSRKWAIKLLVMPEERKMTIQALVKQYNTASLQDGGPQHKQWGADYIESKGEGQIFLLHGGPGVGKSLPLLSLNVGDIGTSEDKVEDRLSYWFSLAEKWGAVMLIDEADVYLERRTVSDLRRNGIVSGHFDDAFVSRIHLVIHYEPLGERERRKIWTQFFEKLEDERKDISIASRARNYVLHDPEINDVKWNGREIRNGNIIPIPSLSVTEV
ncbi:P-loop containing nucleoside triphosphate hydrolase [Apiospora rasikravindrae]|uniref:P-loop containing nucleoside triphosphate hydrolase n=1 Tax=Apiospora rasikravindrae TaxID=990691 RepID=A0ABR1S2N3_9PEZI